VSAALVASQSILHCKPRRDNLSAEAFHLLKLGGIRMQRYVVHHRWCVRCFACSVLRLNGGPVPCPQYFMP